MLLGSAFILISVSKRQVQIISLCVSLYFHEPRLSPLKIRTKHLSIRYTRDKILELIEHNNVTKSSSFYTIYVFLTMIRFPSPKKQNGKRMDTSKLFGHR